MYLYIFNHLLYYKLNSSRFGINTLSIVFSKLYIVCWILFQELDYIRQGMIEILHGRNFLICTGKRRLKLRREV